MGGVCSLQLYAIPCPWTSKSPGAGDAQCELTVVPQCFPQNPCGLNRDKYIPSIPCWYLSFLMTESSPVPPNTAKAFVPIT